MLVAHVHVWLFSPPIGTATPWAWARALELAGAENLISRYPSLSMDSRLDAVLRQPQSSSLADKTTRPYAASKSGTLHFLEPFVCLYMWCPHSDTHRWRSLCCAAQYMASWLGIVQGLQALHPSRLCVCCSVPAALELFEILSSCRSTHTRPAPEPVARACAPVIGPQGPLMG